MPAVDVVLNTTSVAKMPLASFPVVPGIWIFITFIHNIHIHLYTYICNINVFIHKYDTKLGLHLISCRNHNTLNSKAVVCNFRAFSVNGNVIIYTFMTFDTRLPTIYNIPILFHMDIRPGYINFINRKISIGPITFSLFYSGLTYRTRKIFEILFNDYRVVCVFAKMILEFLDIFQIKLIEREQ